MTAHALSAQAYAAALACLPGIGPATLARLLRSEGPAELWEGVLDGRVRRPSGRRGDTVPSDHGGRLEWEVAARRVDLQCLWRRCQEGGIGVTWLGDGQYPSVLREDPAPPGVLFWRGDLGKLDNKVAAVAIVGTRRCTPEGRAIAFELGRDLTAAGVCVVSGLALGIDGAAHEGALQALGDAAISAERSGAVAGPAVAGPVGVAASGVDRPYPARHAALWERVVLKGAVLSETPPGWPAQAWRFPARNRVIAALVRIVVVVESHSAGGALITADAAIDRGIEVRAVPGPVRSPACVGTNQLIYDGAAPARNSQDVLDALGWFERSPRGDRRLLHGAGMSATGEPFSPALEKLSPAQEPPVKEPPVKEPPPAAIIVGGAARLAVLGVLSWRPTSLNQLVARCGLPIGEVWQALQGLAEEGAVVEDRGWWSRAGNRSRGP